VPHFIAVSEQGPPLLSESILLDRAAPLHAFPAEVLRQLPFSATIIAALRNRHNLKSHLARLRKAGGLDAGEIARLLGTGTRTIYLWHKDGKLRGHLYNNEGDYLYERPGMGSALEDPKRRYRHGKTSRVVNIGREQDGQIKSRLGKCHRLSSPANLELTIWESCQAENGIVAKEKQG
jgi:hypothetical protein